jgi:hypothetical protein
MAGLYRIDHRSTAKRYRGGKARDQAPNDESVVDERVAARLHAKIPRGRAGA